MKTNSLRVKIGLMTSLLVTLVLMCVYIPKVHAMLDPAVVYCQACGYNYSVEITEYGEQSFCTLPNNEKVDAWDFLTGKNALEWSYCAINGYEAKHVENSDICMDCCVCVLPDSSEIEVTQLMNLNFNETTCGDGTCGLPENADTCPSDCPSGGMDEYCDGIADGKCDPDCAANADPDCSKSSVSWPLIGGIIGAVIVIGFATILFIRRRRPSKASSA